MCDFMLIITLKEMGWCLGEKCGLRMGDHISKEMALAVHYLSPSVLFIYIMTYEGRVTTVRWKKPDMPLKKKTKGIENLTLHFFFLS